MLGKSIYKKLVEDFSFLQDYGFSFNHYSKHYVTPSVVFKKGELKVQIGYSYEENIFYINIYDLMKVNPYLYDNSNHILENITLNGRTYKEQVDQVKTILLKYIQKNISEQN